MSTPRQRIAVLGYGHVGSTLAHAFLDAGHDVVIAINPDNPDGLAAAQAAQPGLARAASAPLTEAVQGAAIVVVAVPFAAAAPLLAPLADTLDAVVIDATNPVGPGLTHALGSRSGAESLAEQVPLAAVVKCFNVYGYENLGAAPAAVGAGRALMPYAADDADAKATVARLLDGLGWDGFDAGPLSAALDLEHLALLWIRAVRAGGRDGRFVWSALRWAS